MKIRMEISDDLYINYKELAERNGFAVTKLNQIIFEKAIKDWIVKNEADEIISCIWCGKELTDSDSKFYVFDDDSSKKLGGVCKKCMVKAAPKK